MVSLINKPYYNEFMNLVANSKNSIKLCAPFIKNDITERVSIQLKQRTQELMF